MFVQSKKYDVLVIGGGHAGCEAVLASARMGCSTLMLTTNLDTIALMSCNPAIGGLAKGQLVKEIDALGGEMAKNIDVTGIQFRRLNTKKGSAVISSRAQADRQAYRLRMKSVLEKQENLELRQGLVERLLVESGEVYGVETAFKELFLAKTVIITTGTFLNGLIHIGLNHFPAGRMGDAPSIGLAENLRDLGFEVGRLKTGTTPRLNGNTIDFSKTGAQKGDDPPHPFSFSTGEVRQKQVVCYVTYTNPRTHEIIKRGLDRSPLFTGVIKGTGARYCPSIEDKVVRFAEKDRHQIFLEPEGYHTVEYYPNGLATSLPLDIQVKMLRSISGLEDVEVMRPGYAIEYDYINPIQLKPTLETKQINNLFHAGQINGTSGYEEAAAQGLIAGANAVLRVRDKEPFILNRSEAYIGVLIDDLVTKGTEEPYRMFTSRAEYRLLLREDNADLRLMEKGYQIGLIKDAIYKRLETKKEVIGNGLKRLKATTIYPRKEVNDKLVGLRSSPLRNVSTLEGLLKRPEISYQDLYLFDSLPSDLPDEIVRHLEIHVKYKGYIDRQQQQVEQCKKMEEIVIPPDLDYREIPGLSREVREKLVKIRPYTLGQTSRISGITPAAISILTIYLKKMGCL
ncbi:MAG: tRNA uridine-5-carboxymethylaminomethyl(34) synthesis enzyme MnmG [Thermodesulfobacteriota bacterium]